MVQEKQTKLFQPVLFWSTVLIGILTMALADCGGKHLDDRLTKTYEDAPRWVMHGSDFYKGKEDVAFYGVGSSVLTHIKFRREQAEHDAIANVGRIFHAKAGKLTSAYGKAIAQGPHEYDEELFRLIEEVFTHADVTGSHIVDHWVSQRTGEEFALAVLRPSDMRAIIDQVSGLSREMREEVQRNAEEAFDLLRRMEDDTP